MDNYEVAINGTTLAARILGIKTPDVQFFYNQDMTAKGINSIFLKERNIIAFNEEWIEQANPMEIQVTCFHETRHAFQWKLIQGEYQGDSNIDSKTIQIWKEEMNSYNSPTKKDIPEDEYLIQKIEIDAIAFAHLQMKKIYNVTSFIPVSIKKEVNEIIKSIT
jgi:hypothetical protein